MIFYEVYHLNFFLYFFENFFSIKFNFFWEYNTNLNNTIQKKRIIIFYDNVYIYQLLYIFLIFLSYKIKILLHKVWFSIINQINTCEKWVLYPDNFLKADIFFFSQNPNQSFLRSQYIFFDINAYTIIPRKIIDSISFQKSWKSISIKIDAEIIIFFQYLWKELKAFQYWDK